MGFRFFKRIKILPGVSLNLSKSGPSISVGPRGLKMTVGPKGVRKTVGIPGTGIYWTEQSSTSRKRNTVDIPAPPMLPVNSASSLPKSKGNMLIILSIILLLFGLLFLPSSYEQGMLLLVLGFGLFVVSLYLKFVARPLETTSSPPAIISEENSPADSAVEAPRKTEEKPDVIDSAERADGAAPPQRAAIQLQEVPIPGKTIYRIRSASDPSKSYEADIEKLTCTCPNWTERGSKYEGRDVRRMCKHLFSAMASSGILPAFDSLMHAMAEGGSVKGNLFQARMNSGEPVYFGAEKDDPWIDVYARKRKKGDMTGSYTGGFARYGFKVDQDGWSYGSGPAGAREIREMIPEVVKKVSEVSAPSDEPKAP